MTTRLLEWDCAGRPLPGEGVSGDRAVVARRDGGAVATVADGLGHGPAAALAAERVLDAVQANADADVVALVERCHRDLRETRGAAVSVAAIDAGRGSLTWLGVGNVEGRIVHVPGSGIRRFETLTLNPGVVGHELPPLRDETLTLERGDLLLMTTDGIDPSFADALQPSGSCSSIARAVLERHARATDDALVVVIRYLGGER